MKTREMIDKFLAARRIAIVGASTDEKHISRMLMRELMNRGYEIVPINPRADQIEGQKAYNNLKDIPVCPNAVLIAVPADKAFDICREAKAVGVDLIWLFRSAATGPKASDAISFCQDNDIDVIPGYCPFMFLPNSGFIHSLHAFFLKLGGKYPS
jgi:hypothetical protein